MYMHLGYNLVNFGGIQMARNRTYTNEEKSQVLEEVKTVGNIAVVAKKNNIPIGTISSWINPKKSKKSKFKDPDILFKENNLLKFKLRDYELENKILKELLKKTYQIWNTK